MTDNPSFVLRGIENLSYEHRPIREVGDDEVLVAVQKTGICGSDVHYMVHGQIGDFIVEKPMVTPVISCRLADTIDLGSWARIFRRRDQNWVKSKDCQSG